MLLVQPSQALWYMLAVLILERLRQENFRESEGSFGCIESSRLAWATQQVLSQKKKSGGKCHLEKGKNGFPERTSVRREITEVRKWMACLRTIEVC